MSRLAPLLALLFAACPHTDPLESEPCVPRTCAGLGALCGPVGDGCGGLLPCGSCGAGEACGAGGPGRCGPSICTESGFCWESPLPQGNTLNAALAFGSDDVWLAGDAGTVLRWNGAHWSATPTGTEKNLAAIWGANSGELWAAGGDALRRWNGTTWSTWPAPNAIGVVESFADLDGATADDVWLAGNAVFRWNGSNWAEVGGATGVYSLTVAAPGDVWAISALTSVLRWQGGSWTTVRSGEAGLTSIWSASPTDVWVGRSSSLDDVGALLHWDGARWTELTALAGTSLANTSPVVRGSGPDDVWVVTGGGLVFHKDASGWRQVASQGLRKLRAVAATGIGTAVAGGDGGELVEADGSTATSLASGWTQNGPALTRTLDGEIVAVKGSGGVATWNGTGWEARPVAGILDPESGNGAHLWAAWGATVDELWAAGTGLHDGYFLVWHLVDGQWAGVAGSHAFSLWGSSSHDVWGVGAYSTVIHYGPSLTSSGGTGPNLEDLWGSAPDDLWAVGLYGTILHGTTGTVDGWTAVDSTTTENLYAVWGSGPDDVWAGGQGGLLHWDGNAWSSVAVPVSGSIMAIWGSGPLDVWALESTGHLHHLDAGGWTRIFTGTGAAYVALQGDGTSDLWIGGNGALLHLAR